MKGLISCYLGCGFPVKCRYVYAAWLALLRLPNQRCWQKLRKQTDISQEIHSPGDYNESVNCLPMGSPRLIGTSMSRLKRLYSSQ